MQEMCFDCNAFQFQLEKVCTSSSIGESLTDYLCSTRRSKTMCSRLSS